MKNIQISKKYVYFFLILIIILNLFLISHRMSFNLELLKILSPNSGLKQSMHGNQYYVLILKYHR